MTISPQPSPDFRPDPKRGLFLFGEIDQSTLDRLTPDIVRLQSESRAPITLYIDSNGGSVGHAAFLYRTLTLSDQDGASPCRLITVATGTAASAAADLLMAGNYALAFPHAIILCHGVRRRSRSEALTQETAIDLAKDLAKSNEQFAIQLADNCINRFIFRVAFLASEFPQIRQNKGNALLQQTECFIEALRSRISDGFIRVLEDALKRSVDNDALDVFTTERLKQVDIMSMPKAQFEALLLKLILDYETEQHATDPQWSIRQEGFERIQDKLELLINKYDDHHAEMISSLCTRWQHSFLTDEQELEISQLPEEQRPLKIQETVREILRPLWFFFVSVCRQLQKEDYVMSAEEAYWLGLIDEVISRTDLPCPRIFVEYPPPENGENNDPSANKE